MPNLFKDTFSQVEIISYLSSFSRLFVPLHSFCLPRSQIVLTVILSESTHFRKMIFLRFLAAKIEVKSRLPLVVPLSLPSSLLRSFFCVVFFCPRLMFLFLLGERAELPPRVCVSDESFSMYVCM